MIQVAVSRSDDPVLPVEISRGSGPSPIWAVGHELRPDLVNQFFAANSCRVLHRNRATLAVVLVGVGMMVAVALGTAAANGDPGGSSYCRTSSEGTAAATP